MVRKDDINLPALSLALPASLGACGQDSGCCGALFWGFICFGALIILAQLIPAVLVIIGFVRGFPIKHKPAGNLKEDLKP